MVTLFLLLLLGPVCSGSSSLLLSCSLPFQNSTLLGLSHAGVLYYASTTPAECCMKCASMARCATWSYTGSLWTPSTPCHLSPYAPVTTEHNKEGCAGGSAPDAPPAPVPPSPPPPPPGPITGTFKVDTANTANTRQTIEGLGFEIQADSIGSGTDPSVGSKISGVPHDLVAEERTRLYNDMLLGFRTCRLALVRACTTSFLAHSRRTLILVADSDMRIAFSMTFRRQRACTSVGLMLHSNIWYRGGPLKWLSLLNCKPTAKYLGLMWSIGRLHRTGRVRSRCFHAVKGRLPHVGT